jgi:hypothetical protein
MTHKTENLDGLTVRQLRALRRRLASSLTDPQAVLRGTLLSQGRRCGKENCRCVDGELHGPYRYVSIPQPGGRPHKVYVPARLLDVVSGKVATAGRFEAVLAEITAVNAELLARRELD